MASSETVQTQSPGEESTRTRRAWATPRVIAAVDARAAGAPPNNKGHTGGTDFHSSATTVYS